jgi:hypothetical protein
MRTIGGRTLGIKDWSPLVLGGGQWTSPISLRFEPQRNPAEPASSELEVSREFGRQDGRCQPPRLGSNRHQPRAQREREAKKVSGLGGETRETSSGHGTEAGAPALPPGRRLGNSAKTDMPDNGQAASPQAHAHRLIQHGNGPLIMLVLGPLDVVHPFHRKQSLAHLPPETPPQQQEIRKKKRQTHFFFFPTP